MGGECIGNSYNQTPHPFSREWCDPEWRSKWLIDLDDDQLESLSDGQLRDILPAFELVGLHRVFGQHAVAVRQMIESIINFKMVNTMTFNDFKNYKQGLDLLSSRSK
jgi:hypothetical protein